MTELSDIISVLDRLVAFPSISQWPNKPIISYISGFLKSYGINSYIVAGPNSDRANLYATVGPNVAGGVILSGHMDVVPVDGQDWHSDPFKVTNSDNRLYCRGACDMKSFLAIALAMVPDMLTVKLKRPVHLAFSCDEEIGCVGVGNMIAELKQNLPPVDAVIVGEPTSMGVVDRQKGITDITVTVTGKEGHSSDLDNNVSAITAAAKLITYIDQLTNTGKVDSAGVGEHDTAHCGLIEGGTAINIVANKCRFSIDIRSFYDQAKLLHQIKDFAARQIEPAMQAVAPQTGFEFIVNSDVPPFKPETHNRAVTLAKQLTGQTTTSGVAFAAESGHFQQSGFSTVICGPGSIDQAHKANEFITINQVKLGQRFVARLIDSLCN